MEYQWKEGRRPQPRRAALRQQMENEGRERIRKSTPDGRVSFSKYQVSIRDADMALEDNNTGKRYQEQKRSKEWEKDVRQQKSR